MGCGLAAPEQECEIASIVRVAAKPTHTDLVAWIIPKDILSLVFSTLGVV